MTFKNLNLDRTALLIIDLQADIFSDGALKVVGATEALPKAQKVLDIARRIGLPIIHTKLDQPSLLSQNSPSIPAYAKLEVRSLSKTFPQRRKSLTVLEEINLHLYLLLDI